MNKNNLKNTLNLTRHCECREESILSQSSLCLTRRSIELNSNGCPIKSGMTRKGERGRSTPTLSFSDLIRESIGRTFKTPRYSYGAETGRSMVEMLGVLAIVGVLSVGGVYGYGVAMKKHKANELMAATMQEAVLISAQLATGKTNPTLSGINNSLFTSASTVTGTDNFKIVLKTVDSDVCNQMKSMLGVSSMVHAISDDCGEMTFHKNLTPKAVTQSGGNSGGSGSESDGNSGEGEPTEPVDPCADVDCGDNGTCVDGACKCEDGWTGELCDTKDCSIYTDGGACDSNGCIPIYFEQQNYFGCYNSAKEALDEANKNSCLIGGIGPYYSNAFHCSTGLNFTAALPCFYPDKYTCDSGLAKQCKNGTWNKIELCLSGCRNILGSSVDEICDALDD